MSSADAARALPHRFVLFLCAAAGLFWATGLRADSWDLPKVETYVSADGRARLTVTPRRISNQLRYFEDRVAGRAPAGRPPENVQTSASGRLERRGSDGRWQVVWERPLLNDVAPVRVLVANGGRRVATFDNWHSVGGGDHVVVIYDEAGRPLRSLRLNEVLPEHYIMVLPRSVSSLWWGGEHRFDEAADRLILSVAVPSPGQSLEKVSYLDLPVSLGTGQPEAMIGPSWAAANVAACRNVVAIREGALRRQSYLRAPLLGPTSGEQPDWHEYLREAIARIEVPAPPPANEADNPLADLLGDTASTSTTVLRDPAAPNYAQSVSHVLAALAEESWGPGDIRSIASPAQANLVAVLALAARRVRPGSLYGVRIYVAVDDVHWPSVVQALAPSGAELRQLDPADPIPQRSGRVAVTTMADIPDLPSVCAAP